MTRSFRTRHLARSTRQAGFTTIELLVASAILGIVMVHVLATFSNQMKTYSTQKRISDVQEDARLASEIMVRDIRMAGFMLPVIVGISTRDGGAVASDALCASDSSVVSDASLDTAMERFDGASLSAGLGAGATSVTLVVSDLDIDSDGNDDFTVNRGIIISDGAMTHCARITMILGGAIGFTPATPAGFAVALGPGIASPAVIYELTAAGLLRNFLLVSSVVEDVQVEFAIDDDGDGMIGDDEFPIHDLSGFDLNAIRGVQLSVLTRTDSPDPNVAGTGRQALGNRVAGEIDNFRRRLVSVATASRNL